MGECKETTNKELMEKLEKMDKKLNALCDALLIFISTRGRKEAKGIKARLDKDGAFEGYEWEIKDQMAMANVCQGLNEAMEEKKNTVDEGFWMIR